MIMFWFYIWRKECFSISCWEKTKFAYFSVILESISVIQTLHLFMFFLYNRIAYDLRILCSKYSATKSQPRLFSHGITTEKTLSPLALLAYWMEMWSFIHEINSYSPINTQFLNKMVWIGLIGW